MTSYRIHRASQIGETAVGGILGGIVIAVMAFWQIMGVIAALCGVVGIIAWFVRKDAERSVLIWALGLGVAGLCVALFMRWLLKKCGI